MPHATQDSRADYGAQHIEICRLFQADEPNWPLLCRQVDLALDDEGLPQKFRAEYELILALDTRRPASAAEEHIERARDVITDLIDMHRALEEDGLEGHERDDIRHAIASLNAAVATVEADLEDMPREDENDTLAAQASARRAMAVAIANMNGVSHPGNAGQAGDG
ncbi:hypothetical protein LTR37_008917 [Vermiconidia calcicola]|uniref:Uncharacterized protein n=1 Tax=Vermiconidia calcicola TaxID=1690605 RepID=A0ACC3N9E5_9PEZI|nr:hypothetical protein LTR37_008917 [Vermiconidia calcicola]